MDNGSDFVLVAGADRRVTAVELVRKTLRNAILRGELRGDSRLIQTEIASQLGVSTTPVREAMRDLASEGLISMDSHRVGTVRTPDWEEMAEIIDVRRALEPTAIARSLVNMQESELEEARDYADELAREEDLGSWVQKNILFHSIFHRATKTIRLSSIMCALEDAGGVFVAQAQRLHPEIRKRAMEDHYALIDAFTRRDEKRAVEIQLGHISLPLEALRTDA